MRINYFYHKLLKGFPTAMKKMPQKHLQKCGKNFWMDAIMWLRWSSHCDGFETNFIYLELVYSNFRNLTIKKINWRVRLILFLTSGTQNIWCVANCIYWRVKRKKIYKFIPDRKNATIIAFYKPISEKLSPNIRTENLGPSHPLSLAMKYKFEKFIVKCLC